MLLFVLYFLTTLAVPVQKLNGKVFIGYWGSAANLPKLTQIPEALKRGYNVISLAFGDTLKSDGSFEIHTNLGTAPTKDWISQNAGIDSSSWQYILSFGGQNAAGPVVSDTQTYVNGFMKCFMDAHTAYGFDGIDIDIETGMTTPLLTAFRQIFQILHKSNFAISMAPQPLNIDPEESSLFMEGSFNAYVPLIDSTIIDTVSYVAPQMYNNPMPLRDIVLYLKSMQKSHTIAWKGSKLVINIPSEKIIFGYPAADGAAPSGPSNLWEDSGKSILHKYQTTPELMATGGIMTWSIGWDASNNWEFIDNVSKIWTRNNSTQPPI